MRVKNLTEAKKQAVANAKFSGEPRYITTDTSGNTRVEKKRPKPQRWETYWEALPDGTLRQVVLGRHLAEMSVINSKHMPCVINDGGTRKQWVGIGWVDEGPYELTGEEVWVHNEDEEDE